MNSAYFIASRLIKGENKTSNFTKPIIKISVLGIALGLIVMIIAVSIVNGFKTKIRDKVIGFSGHIQILNYDINTSFEPNPIDKNQAFLNNIRQIQGVRHIQSYAIKSGIIKTNENIEGVVLKGISNDFDWSFFNTNLIEGEKLNFNDSTPSNDILISNNLALKLRLKLNETLVMYFIQQPPRVRKFRIAGIYQTGLEEFDKLYLIGDLRHIQKLNDWDSNVVSGLEIYLNNFDQMLPLTDSIDNAINYDLVARNIQDLNPQIFDWLNLQNINIILILSLMILVAGINMISTLLILILEKTPTIGLLKALGMNNKNIRKIFILNAAYIIGRGLFWGNLIGLTLCFIQSEFGIIKLDETNYYLKEVPILLNYWHILFLNIGTMVICLLMLLIPSHLISKVSPVKAIRVS